jgi:hypothetical protein
MAEENQIKELKIGEEMPDGTIYAGISPDTNKPMYIASEAVPLNMEFNKAVKYAQKLKVHGHKDWRIATPSEMAQLFYNRKKGKLSGKFNIIVTPDLRALNAGADFSPVPPYDAIRDFTIKYRALAVRCDR